MKLEERESLCVCVCVCDREKHPRAKRLGAKRLEKEMDLGRNAPDTALSWIYDTLKKCTGFL